MTYHRDGAPTSSVVGDLRAILGKDRSKSIIIYARSTRAA
jgi:hypothetical protein